MLWVYNYECLFNFRRNKIVKELLSTEKSYTEDIQIVISGYRDKE